ncbi:hypothetical protein AVEN_118070-1, partial [Araneus ventricosus]
IWCEQRFPGVKRGKLRRGSNCSETDQKEFNSHSSTMPPAYGTCEPIAERTMRDLSRSSSAIDQSTPLIIRRR